MGGDSGISAFPEEDNIFCWKGTINGSKDTVFEGTQYRLSLSFPNDYPFKPPKVKFETLCFHPNVDVRGHICLDILQVLYCHYFISAIKLFDIFSTCNRLRINCRINGLQLMMWEPFSCQSRVCLVVNHFYSFPFSMLLCVWIPTWIMGLYIVTLLMNVGFSMWITEPNTSSPLNPQAAQLWGNQDGKIWACFVCF